MEIKRVILKTSGLDQLTAFYQLLLELPVEQHNLTETTIRVGATSLLFQKTENTDPFYHFAINIPCNKITEARAWLQRKLELIWMDDYKSDVADFVNWHAKSVYFFDPAGNIVELIARFDLDNKTDQPFSPGQFLSISEVGIVFKAEELEKHTGALIKRYNLDYFDKQPPLPQFKAVGDDSGLFIIVPENRNWYPTRKASGIFPLSVEFDHKGQQHHFQL